MQKNTIYILLAVVLLAGVYMYMKKQQEKKDAKPETQPEPAPAPVPGSNKSKPASKTEAGKIDRYKILKLGSKGPEVIVLQKFLKPWSFNKITPDGNFGKITEGYLVSYKSSKGITTDPKSTSIAELNADGKGNIFGL